VGLLKALLYGLLALVFVVLIGARFGWLSGRPPSDLGVTQGYLKPPSLTRNSVSSPAGLSPDHQQRAHALRPPLPLKHGDATASLRTLATVLQMQPGMTLVKQRPDYLYAQAQTRWLRFVDDLEFWFNPARGVIEVRSASRLGREDAGLNRRRLEYIRAAYLRQ
jgi:uncharacterized protein (DUF1499 family)